MRYVVTTGPQRMEVREGPAPVPADGQALVRVEAVGLCGSDYHLYDGTHPYSRFPQVQGHELVGRVEALPVGHHDGLNIGQRVAVEPLVNCGACFACRRGRYNCCAELKVMGAHLPGGLADHIAVSAARLHPTGDLPAEVAVLTEPVSIGLQCVHRAAVAADDPVVVLGAGPIGQAAALGAVHRGARVLVADKERSRLAHARRLGAHRVVDTTAEDLAGATAEFTGGEGAAVVIDATGVPALIRLAVDLVAHSGTVVVVGISTAEVALPVTEFSRKELNLLGSRNNTGLFPEAADLVARYADRLAPLVTHVFGLDEVPKAIEYARAHPDEVEKVVIRVAD
jgi:threonine dehydrogenase-like Zn-dependent dehydrogenase